jgi:hypothetical protein
MTGDALRHTVIWKNQPDLKSLAGKIVSLRIRLKDAALFSFAFRE